MQDSINTFLGLPPELEGERDKIIHLLKEAYQHYGTSPRLAAQRLGQLFTLVVDTAKKHVPEPKRIIRQITLPPDSKQALVDIIVWERLTPQVEELRLSLFGQVEPPFLSLESVDDEILQKEALIDIACELEEAWGFGFENVKEYVLTGKTKPRSPVVIMVHTHYYCDDDFDNDRALSRFIVAFNAPNPTWRLMQTVYHCLKKANKTELLVKQLEEPQQTRQKILREILNEVGPKPKQFGEKGKYYQKLSDAWNEKTGESINPDAMRKRYERHL